MVCGPDPAHGDFWSRPWKPMSLWSVPVWSLISPASCMSCSIVVQDLGLLHKLQNTATQSCKAHIWRPMEVRSRVHVVRMLVNRLLLLDCGPYYKKDTKKILSCRQCSLIAALCCLQGSCIVKILQIFTDFIDLYRSLQISPADQVRIFPIQSNPGLWYVAFQINFFKIYSVARQESFHWKVFSVWE